MSSNMNSIILGVSSFCSISLLYTAYLNRIKILENCNYHYINAKQYVNNINPITVIETIKLKSATIYYIKLLDSLFIVNDLNINIDDYKSLKNSLVIPHSPEDILEAVLKKGSEEIDITDLSKLLIGPFLDQITDKNEKWIFEFLEERHNYSDINALEITLINGKTNNLKNRNI